MNLRGIDCSNPISGAALKAAKMDFAFRYDCQWVNNPKVATRAEVEDHLSNGVAEGVVYEDNQYSVTPAQAKIAVAHAQQMRRPQGTAIIMACDMPQPPPQAFSDMSQSGKVLRDAGFLAGWYGNKDVARQLQSQGLIDVAWIIEVIGDSWGTSQPNDQWNFRQLPNVAQPPIGGVDCDADDAPFPVGLWLPSIPTPPSPQTPTYTPIQGDPDVSGKVDVPIKTDADGSGSAPFNVDYDRVMSYVVQDWDSNKVGCYFGYEGVGFNSMSPGVTQVSIKDTPVKSGLVTVRVWFTTGTPA